MSIADLSNLEPSHLFCRLCRCVVIGECLSRLTKGNVSSLMFASAIFLFGFWLNILPDNVTSAPGLAAAMSNFGVGLLIVNLGTLIDLEDMIKEWKTVVVALLGMVGVVIGPFTIGAMLFGREWALTAVPPPLAAPSQSCWCRLPPTPPAVRKWLPLPFWSCPSVSSSVCPSQPMA